MTETDSEPHSARAQAPLGRDEIVARRNVLFGLWAAQELGLPEAEREAYALGVHIADYAEPGRDDVLRKVAADLAAAGLPASDHRLREVLAEMELRAELQLGREGAPAP
jgi:hypothetical protein